MTKNSATANYRTDGNPHKNEACHATPLPFGPIVQPEPSKLCLDVMERPFVREMVVTAQKPNDALILSDVIAFSILRLRKHCSSFSNA